MTKARYLLITISAILILFFTSTIVNAANITYNTEYFDATNTAVYVNGLDNNLEDGYGYYIYISQDNKIDANTIISNASMAKLDVLKYDTESKKFYIKISTNTGSFEKTGDYYAYIVKGRMGYKNTFSLVDGPTKLERPESLPNGKRIKVSFNQDSTSYFINQYAYYTKLYGTDRKVEFYLGKIEDPTILKKLSNTEADAHDILYAYAKNNNNYLYSGSFDTGTTSVLNYNLFKDYTGFKNGEYYFVYYKLDDENGKYVEMDDVQAYTVTNQGFLDRFITYTAKEEEKTTEEVPSEKTDKTDETVASGKLPQTGLTIGLSTVLIIVIGLAISVYFKYNKLKDIK